MINNKTISVLLCKRLDYGRRVLEHIEKCSDRESEKWKTHVFIDVPGHKSDLPYHMGQQSVEHEAIVQMAQSFDFVEQVTVAKKQLGLKSATKWALREMFVRHKSDFNLHVEDDILLGPDALSYAGECASYLSSQEAIDNKIATVTLQGWMGAGSDVAPESPQYCSDRPSDLNKIFAYPHFTCGWGWGMTRKFYFSDFFNMEDQKVDASWATDLFKHFRKHNYRELRSNARKTKNIGEDFSTHFHGKIKSNNPNLNCLDVEDEWSGADQPPVWNWEFSL